MLHDKYTIKQLQAACLPTEKEREIQRISDLTLGEYIRLVENPDNWKKLAINIDREIFIEKLNKIRNIRNDVMHFDPDGMSDEDLSKLREFVRLLQSLAKYGAI